MPTKIDGTDIFYDVGQDDLPGQPITPGISDLSKKTKITLGHYLSERTKGTLDPKEANNPPIDDSFYREIQMTLPNGNIPPIEKNTNGSGQFLKDADYIQVDTKSSFPTAQGKGLLRKGKSDNQSDALYDGNTLLKSITPTNNDVDKNYVSPILQQNRFTSNTAFSGGQNSPWITNQKELGVYHKDAKALTPDQLGKVGGILTLRSTGTPAATRRDFDPDSLAASEASLIPGKGQLGLEKLDGASLDVTDILSNILNEPFGTGNNQPSSQDSYGNMNNPLDPFAGIAPLGMIALATALILAAQISIKVILATVTLITNANKNSAKKKDSIGRYFLGKYNFNQNSVGFPPIPLPASLFGIQPTAFPFDDCVSAGMNNFFGGLGGTFDRATEAPGFYVVFVRAITRSANTIGSSIGNIHGNPINVAENIIGFIEIIQRSKIIAALNMFAQIGDRELNLRALGNVVDTSTGVTRISDTDAISDQAQAVTKQRLTNRLKLAWSQNRTPSLMMIPTNVYGAGLMFNKLGGINISYMKSVGNEINASATSLFNNPTDRLDRSFVENAEVALDAEYVPFYFHDLRTNEIISFHAFLSNISDSFSPTWEASEAYGRIDDVQIYKNTKRKISLGFVVAATSPSDFNEMYLKVNKLITMVYPQYSAGSQLVIDDNTKFIQPFSQIPTSSPIIRLRLGDLFRSNYSRFALGRLFGLGTDSLKIDKSIQQNTTTNVVLNEQSLTDKLNKIRIDDIFWINAGNYRGAQKPASFSIGGTNQSAELVIKSSHVYKVKISSIGDDGTITAKIDPSWSQNASIPRFGDLQGLDFEIGIDDITTNYDYYDKLSRQQTEQNIGGDMATVDGISKFLSEDNAVVRSFKSISGKGLACKIDNLEFDHLNNGNFRWETEAYGSRGPMMMAINMSVTPIHDISPGIDASGFDRAPVYNVGDIVRSVGGDSWDEGHKGEAVLQNTKTKR